MSMNELQKQTNANIQAKANLIWEIATHLVGLFKPHEYGKVILPMTVLKRFDDALKPTKDAVVEMAKKLDAQHVEGAARDGILCRISGYDFYNTSNFDFAKLIADPNNVESNFDAYLQGFSTSIGTKRQRNSCKSQRVCCSLWLIRKPLLLYVLWAKE